MRIAIFTDLQTINSNYRAFPVAALAKRGHEIRLDGGDVTERLAILKTFDVIHIYRYHDDGVRQIAEELRRAGVAVVWDNDDDLTTGPDTKGQRRVRGALKSQQLRSDMIRTMRLAHVVTTSSDELAEQYREWGAESVHVVENYLPTTYAVGSVPAHDGLVIGWTAAGEHTYDLAALGLRDALRHLLTVHPNLHVRSVGIDLGLPRDRYTHTHFVQYTALAGHVAQFDIGIAPIADVPFNRARSNVKVKEYAAAGVPWLASPIGPYADLGEKQGGRLVGDDEWCEALDRMVRNVRERRKLAKNARRWARGQTVLKNLDAWERPLVEATRLARR